VQVFRAELADFIKKTMTHTEEESKNEVDLVRKGNLRMAEKN